MEKKKPSKYKVGDKVKYKEFDVIIKGMNYYSPSNVLTYLVKGYPLGHNGGITGYHYNELGFEIQHVEGIDYYYVDENELTPISTVSEKSITYTPGTISSKNYYLGQKIKTRIGGKEYIGTIEGFEKDWRENNDPSYIPIRFYGYNNGHDGRYGSHYNYDENGKPIDFNSKSSKGYWFISPDQILETYPGFNTKSIDDVSTTKIPNILDKTDKYEGIERVKAPVERYKPGKSYYDYFPKWWDEAPHYNSKWYGAPPAKMDDVFIKHKLSHQSAIVMKSPSKKTKFNFIKK